MGVTARITGEEKEPVVLKAITFYNIAVSEDEHQWIVQKRYSQFAKLDKQLRSSGELSRLDLPSKGLFGLRHQLDICNFNNARQTGLNSYLDHLTRQVERLAQSPTLSAFLEAQTPSQPLIGSSRPSSSRPSSLGPEELPAEALQGAVTPPWRGSPAAAARCQWRPYSPSRGARELLEGEEWRRFEAGQPALAGAIRRCVELGASKRFENDCEGAFVTLRRALRAFVREAKPGSPSGFSLEEVPGKEFVWEFLLRVAARRVFFRNQAAEVASILEASEPWALVLEAREDLRRLRAEALQGAGGHLEEQDA
mmetsp:Transcript_39987/g.123319  ORF Transcript_39987/g.123319 Transcript_39987/m.123319 type:complete len:310 (+) Transcript_39987:85-1014(+)